MDNSKIRKTHSSVDSSVAILLSFLCFLLLVGCGESGAPKSSIAGGNASNTKGSNINEAAVHGTLVRSQAEFESAIESAKPGDTVVLANGVWADFEILFTGFGTEEAPITLTAEEKGKVIISGRSNLSLAGEYLIVSGLVFKNGHSPAGTVISFRKNDDELANHSRVTEVVIDGFNNLERTESSNWVLLYGKHNRFDHNHLEGKRNRGVTLAVRLNTEDSQENYHRIDHNYFGPRSILGSNGGETLRIGTSTYSLSNSFTVVENNYFDRCNGELEIISNKSGGNTFKGNVFFESRGTLTMRHGSGNFIEDNVFFGNGADHTGGIRVINGQQTVRNNYMEGLSGYRFGGALVVMNGVPNSVINRYHQVEDAVIVNNSLIDSDHIQLAAGSDHERSAVPVSSQFKNNLIFKSDGSDVFTVYDDISGIDFAGNIQHQVSSPVITGGFESKNITLERAENGLMYPIDELSGVGVSRDLNPIEKGATGVDWYVKSDASPTFDGGQEIVVEPGSETIAAAIAMAEAGDQLLLSNGEYSVNQVLVVDRPLSFIGASAESVKIVFDQAALFEIKEGGSLKIQGVTISGASAPGKPNNTVIRTQNRSMLENYELLIADSTIVDLNANDSFNFVSVFKSTFADRIDIVNTHFKNVTGTILKLDEETDDRGMYNAEYVTISDSTFTDIQGALVNYYRGGKDESTFGPHFSLISSELTNVGRGDGNKASASVRLHGVQVSSVNNSTFTDSLGVSLEHTVGEPISHIHDNRFVATAAPAVVELYSEKENTAKIYNNSFSGSSFSSSLD